jgi:AcrR family transcriptional regulator
MDMTETVEDHRTRTAERRRDAMRKRLVESAMVIFSKKGADAAVIDDVIKAADVSRGTFYKYFDSTQALLVAISAELANELMAIVETQVVNVKQPDERIAIGLTLFMETARTYPIYAAFTRKVGLDIVGPATLLNLLLPPHVNEGIAAGRFLDRPLTVHLDLIAGCVLLCIARMTHEKITTRHIAEAVASIMRGMGVPEADADRLAAVRVKPISLPDESLLVRSQQRLVDAA